MGEHPVRTERREDRDNQAQVDCRILDLRKGTRTNLDGVFINAIDNT